MCYKEVDSLDIDGLLVSRQIPIQFGAIRKYRLEGMRIFDEKLSFPVLDRKVDRALITSRKEAISYYFHSKRHVKSGAVEFVRRRKTDKVGNTGRESKEQWVDMTWRKLREGGINELKEIYFTPKGINTVISKGAGIVELQQRYAHVTHFDDDPLTVLLLAKHFPDVDFVLVNDLSTNYLLSNVDMNQYKNVTRVTSLKEV